ncbi:hypothetical protein GCM10011512_20560 [Tersicoccus solisilvae]|uniref:Uncharacterized protein n=1 Tax=Tersicoccus solisilvae TaxID=1882339 RepID=A0ABQ1P9P2_9MICC|nr:hypothetical protein [Tersicoccus solisilvae]GGC93397.1 hypothetical protein GCM10011512_20560 [Tersicoccus solisilvae]
MSDTQESGQHQSDPDPSNIPGHEDGVGIGATSEANTQEPEDDRDAARAAAQETEREPESARKTDAGPDTLDD